MRRGAGQPLTRYRVETRARMAGNCQ
jgi:hypothetical protein